MSNQKNIENNIHLHKEDIPESNTSLIRAEGYSGPIPPPQMLEQYGRIQKDLPERILAMAERQSQHRINLERLIVRGDSYRATMGLLFAFVIALTALVGGFYLVSIGMEGYGIAAIITAIATMVGPFVYREYKKVHASGENSDHRI